MTSKRGVLFKQVDVQRAVRGARSAGMEIARIEIEPSGKIVLLMASEKETSNEAPLDRWLRDHASSS